MLLEIAITLVLGILFFGLGTRLGRQLLKMGATANDFFKGKPLYSLLFLGVYILLIVLALNIPQMPIFPIGWRYVGMRVTWTIMRVLLMGACGVAFTVAWRTARVQAIAVILIGILGLWSFNAAESYFLAPIYPALANNLQPNGIYKQTSNSSCAPAALATLMRYWGIEANESTVARLAETSILGTSMPQLIVAARALGLDGLELSPTWQQMQWINRPGILGVWLFDRGRKLPHAVTLMAMSDRAAVIADPARGKFFTLNQAEFAQIWRNQYVPIFRPAATRLTSTQAAEYLQRWGYLSQPQADLTSALRRFQAAVGLQVTGMLNPETELMLSGPYLENVPRLDGVEVR